MAKSKAASKSKKSAGKKPAVKSAKAPKYVIVTVLTKWQFWVCLLVVGVIVYIVWLVSVWPSSMGPLPVKISFRESSVGKGWVVQVTNLHEKPVGLFVLAHRERTNQDKLWPCYLSPGETMEYGWNEGWEFRSGDKVSLLGWEEGHGNNPDPSHRGKYRFDPKTAVVPY